MMRNKEIILASLILSTCFAGPSLPQPTNKRFSYTVKVIDTSGRAVEGAEIVALSVEYDLADGRVIREPVEKKTTPRNGTVAINLDFSQDRSACIVAWKKSFAVTWDFIHSRLLPVDKSQIVMVLEKPSELSGIVVDENGTPVAGAKVRAELDSSFRESGHRTNAPQQWLTVESDNKGHFCFNNIPSDGTADFLVTAPGKANLYTFMASDSIPGTRYAAGRTDIRIVLSDEARIKGRVVDPVGNPVAGIKLLARPDKNKSNYYSTNRAVSDSNGCFIFKNVAAGTHYIHVVPPKDKTARWIGNNVKVVTKAGQTVENVTVKLKRGRLVEVEVTDQETGKPVSGISVEVEPVKFSMQSYFFQSTQTNSSGIGRVRAPIGRVSLYVGGKDWSNFDETIIVKKDPSRFKVSLQHKPQISGTVRDRSGRAARNVVVVIVPNGNDAVRTDSSGRFLVNLEVRRNKARIFARDMQRNLAGVTRIPASTRPIDVVLTPAMKLTGCVTDPNNRPVPAAKVQLINSYSGWSSRVGEEVVSDTSGRFEIPAVPPPEDCEYQLCFYALGFCHLEHEPITITEPVDNQVELGSFVLQPIVPNLSVSGIVVDADGKPVPDKMVYLDGSAEGTKQPKKNIRTDAEGRFFFNRLSKGPLQLQAGWWRDDDTAHLHAQAGEKDLKIVLGRNNDSTSLIGKPLPELGEFGLQSASETAAGKKVLVCFWDLNQRPSRNCAQQLSKKAESLAEKDIYVVSVLTDDIPERSLAEQLEKYRITIPTGTVKGDIAKTGQTWGFRSQPWLILTDSSHIVRAEGFNLNDLDKKISEVENAK